MARSGCTAVTAGLAITRNIKRCSDLESPVVKASKTATHHPSWHDAKIVLDRSKQFWIFQLGGWTAWTVLLVLRDLALAPVENMLGPISIYAASGVAGLILSTGLRYLYCAVWERSLIIRGVVAALGALGAALLWQPFRSYLDFIYFGEFIPQGDFLWTDLFRGTLQYSYTLFLLWTGLYFFIKYYQLFQLEREKSLRSEALAHEAQVRMLRYQLNPHFLFNTLNAISTLVLQQKTGPANEMLTKLSRFLRNTLEQSPVSRVTLEQEIATARLYLDIEKVRFGERLQLEVATDSRCNQALVPSMLLQPLIENSIKHGISRLEQGGRISVNARLQGNYLILTVADNGPGLQQDEAQGLQADGSGVGLNNVRNRLQEMYGVNYQFDTETLTPSGFQATVRIPFEV